MEFATREDNVKKIDASAKNKWRWNWLNDEKIGPYIKKLKISGQAFCTLCNKSLMYQSCGKYDLQRHVTRPPHLNALKMVNRRKNKSDLATLDDFRQVWFFIP